MENIYEKGDKSGDYYIKIDYNSNESKQNVYYKCTVGDASTNNLDNPQEWDLCASDPIIFELNEDNKTTISYDGGKLDISYNCGAERFTEEIQMEEPPECNEEPELLYRKEESESGGAQPLERRTQSSLSASNGGGHTRRSSTGSVSTLPQPQPQSQPAPEPDWWGALHGGEKLGIIVGSIIVVIIVGVLLVRGYMKRNDKKYKAFKDKHGVNSNSQEATEGLSVINTAHKHINNQKIKGQIAREAERASTEKRKKLMHTVQGLKKNRGFDPDKNPGMFLYGKLTTQQKSNLQFNHFKSETNKVRAQAALAAQQRAQRRAVRDQRTRN